MVDGSERSKKDTCLRILFFPQNIFLVCWLAPVECVTPKVSLAVGAVTGDDCLS